MLVTDRVTKVVREFPDHALKPYLCLIGTELLNHHLDKWTRDGTTTGVSMNSRTSQNLDLGHCHTVGCLLYRSLANTNRCTNRSVPLGLLNCLLAVGHKPLYTAK